MSLAEMQCPDMLDVLHYYFEDNFAHINEEHTARVSAMRETLYQTMYKVEYPYAYKGSSRNASDINPEDMEYDDTEAPLADIDVFNPKKATKPYTPPTTMSSSDTNPFGNILDSPLR